MARTRRRPVPEDSTVHTEAAADAHYEALAEQNSETPTTAQALVEQLAESTKIPGQPAATGFAAKHAPGHIANPSSKRRESFAASARKLPASMSVTAGDLLVRLIDVGDNRQGIGIRVELPEGRTLTDEEKAIIRQHLKGENGEKTGFSWDRDNGMWHKPIVRENEYPEEVPLSRPVAIRLDAERRLEALGAALRQRSADPAGYAEMIRQQREQAANAEHIPD